MTGAWGRIGSMFTGIVEEVGRVAAIEHLDRGARLVVESARAANGAEIGDSIAVNGCCLTVTSVTTGDAGFTADVMSETLRVTSLGALEPGSPVNLERALLAGARLDGHVVQGHVDAVGRIRSLEVEPNATTVWVDAPPEVLRYCVPKGSVAIEGISLTLVDVDAGGLGVSIIPHTWEATNLATKVVGDAVNLEADVLSKYVEAHVRRLAGEQAVAE